MAIGNPKLQIPCPNKIPIKKCYTMTQGRIARLETMSREKLTSIWFILVEICPVLHPASYREAANFNRSSTPSGADDRLELCTAKSGTGRWFSRGSQRFGKEFLVPRQADCRHR